LYPNDTYPKLKPALDTPSLIQLAYDRGEITDEVRLLYLAYAIYDYESLPAQFRGNVGWRGTFVVPEVHEAANSQEVVCSMSPRVRSEFIRLFELDISCERSIWFPVLAGILVIGIMTFVLNMLQQQSQNLFA
jgi:hypothetical protein